MSLSRRRIRAIVWKEVHEYRRNRSVVATMAILPLIFLAQPLAAVFVASKSSAVALSHLHLLLYMLGIPILVPVAIASSSVAGERQQGTLEPVLTTPIRRDELLLGKALAVLIPSIVIAYAVYALFLACAALFADPAVATAIIQPFDILIQLFFTPALALLSIWIGLAISTRTSDVRVAQQLALLGSLPGVAVISLIAFDVIHLTAGLGIVLGATVLLADLIGWRLVPPLFDRERLVTGPR